MIQKIISILFLTSYFLLFISPVSAHLVGQPPFFKVNGEYSVFYPVQSYSAFGDTMPPQDIASGLYGVNEPVSFELEKSQLETIIPVEVVAKTKFLWDFGDGTKGTGFTNTHTYSKPGSYILTIHADTSAFEKGVTPQLLQSVFFNIRANKSDTTPNAIILVNGEQVTKDPKTNITDDVFDVDQTKPVVFDASTSLTPSKVVSYTWDFGDGKTGKGVKVEHTYTEKFDYLTPSLKIVDEKGFISETSVGLKVGDGISNSHQQKGNQIQDSSPSQKYIAIGFASFFLLLGAFLVLKSKRK